MTVEVLTKYDSLEKEAIELAEILDDPSDYESPQAAISALQDQLKTMLDIANGITDDDFDQHYETV